MKSTAMRDELVLGQSFDFRFVNASALILKVTNRCNINCDYCYENVSKKGEDMDINVFKTLITKVIHSTTSDKVELIFHGGEPILVSDDWYNEAVNFATNLTATNDKSIKFKIQTNLLSLSTKKINTLKGLNILPGVSIDDPMETRESFRPFADKAIRNIEKLVNADIKFGLLFTINTLNYFKFKDICYWLEKNGIFSFKANVVYPVGHGINMVAMTKDEISKAQIDILKYTIETGGKKVLEQNTVDILHRFFTKDKSITLCRDKQCGAGSRVLGFNTNGDILPCGRFRWNDENHFLGNIGIIDEDDVYQKRIEKFHSASPENWVNCNDCRAKEICNYGCQAFIIRSKNQLNIECEPTKLLYDFIIENQVDLLKSYQNIRSRIDAYNRKLNYSDYTDKHIIEIPSPQPARHNQQLSILNYDDYSDGRTVNPFSNELEIANSGYTDYYDSITPSYNDGGKPE